MSEQNLQSATNSTSNKNKKKNNKNIFKYGRIIFTIAFLIVVGIMAKDYIVEQNAKKQFDKLSQQTNVESTEGSEIETETELDELAALGIEVPEKDLDWDELAEINEHIYAWIYIPGTNVDYPVLQHPTDDTYYLDYNLDGTKGYPGCIYSEHKYNSMDWMDFNTLLYGHNMKDGTMFKTLHKYKDRDFFEENRYMYIYTPETVYVYDIFAAYENEALHILAYYNFEMDEARDMYLEDVFSMRSMSAHFRDGVEVYKGSKILTLVTCTGNSSTRYFVQGVMVNPPVEEVE